MCQVEPLCPRVISFCLTKALEGNLFRGYLENPQRMYLK